MQSKQTNQDLLKRLLQQVDDEAFPEIDAYPLRLVSKIGIGNSAAMPILRMTLPVRRLLMERLQVTGTHQPIDMTSISYSWKEGNFCNRFDLAFVRGTDGRPFLFGNPDAPLAVEVDDFYIGTLPVTQSLWNHIMGDDSNPSIRQGLDLPVENVSWDEIMASGGFLDRVNQSSLSTFLQEKIAPRVGTFRLPSETEWEYAARGGTCWSDGFQFSGSDDIDKVAWYDRKHGDHTQPAGLKAPNQLGIFDMSGNVWEWCQDVHTQDLADIPDDGTPYVGPGEDRVLRGGCFHNWAVHCTVSKRYEISHNYRDGCIGFRLVLAVEATNTFIGATCCISP